MIAVLISPEITEVNVETGEQRDAFLGPSVSDH